MLPSGLVQLSLTASTAAPAKLAGGVIASDDGSLVAPAQVPLPRSVPALRLHPDGTPAIVTATVSPAPGSVNARLIGLPATPAGSVPVAVAVPPPASHAFTEYPSPEPQKLIATAAVQLIVALAAVSLTVTVPELPLLVS